MSPTSSTPVEIWWERVPYVIDSSQAWLDWQAWVKEHTYQWSLLMYKGWITIDAYWHMLRIDDLATKVAVAVAYSILLVKRKTVKATSPVRRNHVRGRR